MMFEIYKREGILALWRGNFANLLRVAPYSGIQFMVYDIAKRYFASRHSSEKSNDNLYPDMDRVREHMIGGAAAGSISTICTYPLDLARSRLAVTPIYKDGANASFVLFRYMKLWFKEGGIRELYRCVHL